MPLLKPELGNDDSTSTEEVENEEDDPSADISMRVKGPDELESVLDDLEKDENTVENAN